MPIALLVTQPRSPKHRRKSVKKMQLLPCRKKFEVFGDFVWWSTAYYQRICWWQGRASDL